MSWSEKVELELQLSELERVSCRDPTIVAPVLDIVGREPARRARQTLPRPTRRKPVHNIKDRRVAVQLRRNGGSRAHSDPLSSRLQRSAGAPAHELKPPARRSSSSSSAELTAPAQSSRLTRLQRMAPAHGSSALGERRAGSSVSCRPCEMCWVGAMEPRTTRDSMQASQVYSAAAEWAWEASVCQLVER